MSSETKVTTSINMQQQDRNNRIPVGISNRHIHLSREDADKLFGVGYEFSIKKELTQPGQYAYNETVTIVGPTGSIENIRVLGPCREQTQVEILMGDCFKLGIDAPIRLSGNLEGTPGLDLIGPAGEINIPSGVIVAKRHLHISLEEAEKRGLQKDQIIKVLIDTPDRRLILDEVVIRPRKDYKLDCHIDIEEGNAAGLKSCSYGWIVG